MMTSEVFSWVSSTPFGRGYVKKVMVVSDLEKMGPAGDYLYARGGDMGITMITNAADLTDLEMARKLRNLTA